MAVFGTLGSQGGEIKEAMPEQFRRFDVVADDSDHFHRNNSRWRRLLHQRIKNHLNDCGSSEATQRGFYDVWSSRRDLIVGLWKILAVTALLVCDSRGVELSVKLEIVEDAINLDLFSWNLSHTLFVSRETI